MHTLGTGGIARDSHRGQEYRISNREPQNAEGAHFDIRNPLFDILRFA